jgi:hypothetical protein
MEIKLTADAISELKYVNANDEILAEILYLAQNEPDDVLRACAGSWLRLHAVQLTARVLV